jgi:GDP-L-fucose synthase
MNLKLNSKIFLAGHKGMVGSAILRVFKEKNYKRIITVEKKN